MVGAEKDGAFKVRLSNSIFGKVMLTEFSIAFFALLGLILNIIIKEIKLIIIL